MPAYCIPRILSHRPRPALLPFGPSLSGGPVLVALSFCPAVYSFVQIAAPWPGPLLHVCLHCLAASASRVSPHVFVILVLQGSLASCLLSQCANFPQILSCASIREPDHHSSHSAWVKKCPPGLFALFDTIIACSGGLFSGFLKQLNPAWIPHGLLHSFKTRMDAAWTIGLKHRAPVPLQCICT